MTRALWQERKRAGPISMTVTSTILLGAGCAAYLGVGVAVNLVMTNRDAKAAAGSVMYASVAFAAPVAVAWWAHRRGALGRHGALRLAGGLSLAVQLAFSPVAIAMLSM